MENATKILGAAREDSALGISVEELSRLHDTLQKLTSMTIGVSRSEETKPYQATDWYIFSAVTQRVHDLYMWTEYDAHKEE